MLLSHFTGASNSSIITACPAINQASTSTRNKENSYASGIYSHDPCNTMIKLFSVQYSVHSTLFILLDAFFVERKANEACLNVVYCIRCPSCVTMRICTLIDKQIPITQSESIFLIIEAAILLSPNCFCTAMRARHQVW